VRHTGSGRVWALYAGGFLGPFGAGLVTPMFPEIGSALHVAPTTVGWALTAYMIPFALALVVSGSLAERWGRVRVLVSAYALYVLTSVAVAVAPTFGLLLAARGLQGLANAFVTPVLVAMLAGMVAPSRLGATLGRYGALQAAGQAFAPLVGGGLAAVGWRWAFVATAAAAAFLGLVTPRAPGVPAAAPRLRSVLRRDVSLAAGAAATAYVTGTGLTVLTAVWAADRFGLGPTQRGLLIALFGVAGLMGGRPAGRLLDAAGVTRAGVLFALVLAGAAVAALVPHLAVLAVALLLGGATGTGLRAATSLAAVQAVPDNRAGAVSVVLALQFLGAAAAPVLCLPVYAAVGGTAFAVAGLGALVAAGLLALRSPAAVRVR
jgi:MFS family permease